MSESVEIPLVTILYAINTHKAMMENYKKQGVFMPIEPENVLAAMSGREIDQSRAAIAQASEEGYLTGDYELTKKGINEFMKGMA